MMHFHGRVENYRFMFSVRTVTGCERRGAGVTVRTYDSDFVFHILPSLPIFTLPRPHHVPYPGPYPLPSPHHHRHHLPHPLLPLTLLPSTTLPLSPPLVALTLVSGTESTPRRAASGSAFCWTCCRTSSQASGGRTSSSGGGCLPLSCLSPFTDLLSLYTDCSVPPLILPSLLCSPSLHLIS